MGLYNNSKSLLYDYVKTLRCERCLGPFAENDTITYDYDAILQGCDKCLVWHDLCDGNVFEETDDEFFFFDS